MRDTSTGSYKITSKYKHARRIILFLAANRLCIWFGFLLCFSSVQVQNFQKLNSQIAHKFYFGLNSISELKQIELLSSEEQAQLAGQIDDICHILEICTPYTTFTSVYGDGHISSKALSEIQRYLQGLQAEIDHAIANGGTSEQQMLKFQQASSYMNRALSSDSPLITLSKIITEN